MLAYVMNINNTGDESSSNETENDGIYQYIGLQIPKTELLSVCDS